MLITPISEFKGAHWECKYSYQLDDSSQSSFKLVLLSWPPRAKLKTKTPNLIKTHGIQVTCQMPLQISLAYPIPQQLWSYNPESQNWLFSSRRDWSLPFTPPPNQNPPRQHNPPKRARNWSRPTSNFPQKYYDLGIHVTKGTPSPSSPPPRNKAPL